MNVCQVVSVASMMGMVLLPAQYSIACLLVIFAAAATGASRRS